MRRSSTLGFLFLALCAANAPRLRAQAPPAAQSSPGNASTQSSPSSQSPQLTPFSAQHRLTPLHTPTLSPGEVELLKLEDQFEQSVAKGGGKAFTSWFAPDGVTLNNGKPAVRGQRAIGETATWDPKAYQLDWYVEGAQMGPSGQSGFTWGHYETHSHDTKGQPLSSSGRYITFWKKVDGAWKVALDASADDVPASPACRSVPAQKPQ